MKRLLILLTLLPLAAFSQIGFMPADTSLNVTVGGTRIKYKTWNFTKSYIDGKSGVNSFNGRAGAVTAQSGDYTFSQIGSKPTTLSGYGITDAQAALGYTPYNPASYPVNSGGETLQSVTDRANVRSGIVQFSNPQNSAHRLSIGYNGVNEPYLDVYDNQTGNRPSLLIQPEGGSVAIGTTAATHKLTVAGDGSFTGTVSVATPTAGGHATTKAYVDAAVSTGATSGTYTPTITNGTGVGYSLAHEFGWQRIGNRVTVTGVFDVEATTASTSVVLGVSISLPVASDFTSQYNLSGTETTNHPDVTGRGIWGDTATDVANVTFVANTVSATKVYVNFGYVVQ